MHTAVVDQIRADANFERLFTISRDKSLRIWRLSDLRLMRTVWLPAEPGPEGTPYAIAVSPDGRRAYVAGYTGYHWQRAAHIYVVDVGTGLVAGTLGRFEEDAVTAMDLTPDGRRLAVGLGRGGLAVMDTQNGATVFVDRTYAGPVKFVHHATDGRLASAAADGCLRVYATDGRLTYRNQYPLRPANEPQCTGGDLGGVRFSPDGRWIALGTLYLREGERWRPEVALFDAATMTLRRMLRADDPEQRSLCCIAWSPDSRTLYVNGTAEGSRPTPLYRVRDPAAGALERFEVGRQQFTNMLPLPDGSFVFSTTAPSITRLDAGLRPVVTAEPDNIDFHATRERPSAFVLSADAAAIAFEIGNGPWLEVRPFEADASRVLRSGAAPPPSHLAARRTGALQVRAATGPLSWREPLQVNGIAVPLGFEEGVRSYAVHASREIAAFGTNLRVRLVDGRGKAMPGWEDPPVLAAPAWHTVISDDGRWVVVAVGDGTVRWFEVASGQERLGLFVHANARDWVAWRPDGYYASSPGGDQFLGWLVNRGSATSPDFFRAVQFERTLYRPDLVRASLEPKEMKPAGEALRELQARLSAPRVRIESVAEATREIRFSVETTGRPVREIGVYADGLPVLTAAERRVVGTAPRLSRTVALPPGLPLDRIRVEAESDGGLGLDEMAVLQPAPASAGRGRLWVLAIGVEKFDQFAVCDRGRKCTVRPSELPNAPSDASVLVDRLRDQSRAAFTGVRARLLAHRTEAAPTKTRIMAALRELTEAGPEDTVVVFIASHGAAAGSDWQEYYFLPADTSISALERIVAEQEGKSGPPGATLDSLLSASEINDVLRRVAGRRIVIIDTCHSGAAGNINRNPYSIAKRSASASYALVTSSQGSELAYEHVDRSVPHGAFTFALIQGLGGEADVNGDRSITIGELFEYAGPLVRRNTDLLNRAASRNNLQHAPLFQTPMLYAPASLREAPIAGLLPRN